MSKIADIEGVVMSFEEKVTWVGAVASVVVAAAYFWIVGGQLGDKPATEIAYRLPMIIGFGAMIGLNIIGTIAMSIATAISAEIKGEGSADDIDRKDERDVRIGTRGDRASYYALSAFMLGVLAMAMLKVTHFWIANALFASFVVAGLAGSVVKLIAYRRGF